MDISVLQGIYLFLAVFIGLSIFFNFFMNRPIYFPGDLYIQKPNLSFYIPLTSSILLTIVVVSVLRFLVVGPILPFSN